jgi:hypothetical protein
MPASVEFFFLPILAFLIIILEMNLTKCFFPNLALLSCANLAGVTQGTGACSGRHATWDCATSYQSHQLDRCDWCLSHASLFGATQFHEYLTSFFLFLPLHFFLSTLSLHLTMAPLVTLTSPLKSYPVVF